MEVGLYLALQHVQSRRIHRKTTLTNLIIKRALILATIGIIYSYRHQLREHLYVLYGLGGLFLMGLALRAIAISPVP